VKRKTWKFHVCTFHSHWIKITTKKIKIWPPLVLCSDNALKVSVQSMCSACTKCLLCDFKKGAFTISKISRILWLPLNLNSYIIFDLEKQTVLSAWYLCSPRHYNYNSEMKMYNSERRHGQPWMGKYKYIQTLWLLYMYS